MKYSLLLSSCFYRCSADEKSLVSNDTISKAGLFGASLSNSNSVLSDQSDENEHSNTEIILNDGWNPLLYK